MKQSESNLHQRFDSVRGLYENLKQSMDQKKYSTAQDQSARLIQSADKLRFRLAMYNEKHNRKDSRQ